MIHHKNLKAFSYGFSFIEVMVAILMLGMLMTAILRLQTTTFSAVVGVSHRLRRIFVLHNRLVGASLARAQQIEETKPSPKSPLNQEEDRVEYAVSKINEKSALKKFDNVMVQKAVVTWKENAKPKQESIISFFYKAPEKKEAKKQ